MFAAITDVRLATTLVPADLALFDIVGSQSYVGFTGSTGGASIVRQVRSFDLRVAPLPIPAFFPLAVLGIGALRLLRRHQRRAYISAASDTPKRQRPGDPGRFSVGGTTPP
ncbi:hypothetical protein [Dinoroseobacter sp. S124A]|uniref:hypothetical protein n=1 Tax=Dinoroseobacter sp. S124A TaxID=3415128 RepID=UPI003C7B180B